MFWSGVSDNLSSLIIFASSELPVCGMEGHHQAVATDGSNETCNQQTWYVLFD